MNTDISMVTFVSDGLLVNFSNGTHCYFPASFLVEHAGQGSNQVFLDHDPSASHRFSPLAGRQEDLAPARLHASRMH
jgi:hypothetical protein